MKLVLTCEHAGNEIPEEYQYLFENVTAILNSHRGYDPGAFNLFSALQKIADYHQEHHISRLLVEINRSRGNPQLFSEFTRELTNCQKETILEACYIPYRKEVEQHIEDIISKGDSVLHLSIHSFTPSLNGKERNADIGLLYDPGRSEEKMFCRKLKERLLQEDKDLKIRYNYPYLGKADGFTTFLRRKFPKHYLGIEIEVNQKFVKNDILDPQLKMVFLNALSFIKYNRQD